MTPVAAKPRSRAGSLVKRLLAPLQVAYTDDLVLDRARDLAELHSIADTDPLVAESIYELTRMSFWAHLALMVWTHDEKAPEVRYKPFSPLAMYKRLADFADEKEDGGKWAHPIIGVEKSRQLMLSWFVMARLDWCCIHKQRSYTFVVSEELNKARAQVDRVRTIESHYPNWYRLRAGLVGVVPSLKGVNYPNMSWLMSVPQASGRAVASYVPTMGFSDEAAWQTSFERNWTAIKGTAGQFTQLFVVSSANPSYFESLMHDNLDGRKGGREKTYHESQGFSLWRNKLNRIDVARIHYTADPARRTKAWRAQAIQGMAMHEWRQEQEIDYTARGGRPIFTMLDRNYHVTDGHIQVIPLRGGGWGLKTEGYSHVRPVRLLRAIDHGTSNYCAAVWIAVDEDLDWFVYRVYKRTGWFAPENARAIAQLSRADVPCGYETYAFNVIDAMQGLPDQQGKVEDIYRASVDEQGRKPLSGLQAVEKGANSRQVGLDHIAGMLHSTLAVCSPTHPYWDAEGYDEGHRASFRRYSSLYLGRDVAEFLFEELEKARWDERPGNDPEMNRPETSLDMMDDAIDCTRYLIRAGGQLLRQRKEAV